MATIYIVEDDIPEFLNNVDKNQVIKYMTEYPSKTIKNLYSLELLWDYIKIKNCFLK